MQIFEKIVTGYYFQDKPILVIGGQVLHTMQDNLDIGDDYTYRIAETGRLVAKDNVCHWRYDLYRTKRQAKV